MVATMEILEVGNRRNKGESQELHQMQWYA